MCQSCIHVGEKTLESIQCISCPVGCAYSADNPSCSCRRLAKWGGQLPWVRLFLSCPKIPFLPRQAAHIVKTTVLLSGWDLYTQTQRHTVTPQHSQPFVFIAPVSPCRATSVGGTRKKKKNTCSGHQLQANMLSQFPHWVELLCSAFLIYKSYR